MTTNQWTETMTTLHPQQLNRGQRVHRKADADRLQFHVTNCRAKLHVHFHEARKSRYNNFQGVIQAYAAKLKFYTPHALPLNFVRIFRLAQISLIVARSPATRPHDDRETSGKVSGEISRLNSAPCSGNSQTGATAIPSNFRKGDSQDNSRCAGNGHSMFTLETCEVTRNAVTQQPGAIHATARRNPRNGQDNILQDNLLES